MHLWQALSYPFVIQENRRIILYGILLLLVPIFGWFTWIGYSLRLTRHLMQDNSQSLPPISIFRDFLNGVNVAFSYLVYILPIFALAFLSGLVIGLIFGQNMLVREIVIYALLLLYIFLYCGAIIGRIRAAAENEITLIYSILRNTQMVFGNWGWFFRWGLLQAILFIFFQVFLLNAQYIALVLATWFTASLVWIALLIGLFLIAVVAIYLSLSSINLDAQLGIALEIKVLTVEKEKRG